MEDRELYNEKFNSVWVKLNDHENRISESEDKISDINTSFQVSFAITSAALDKLSDLPAAISALQKTNEDVRVSQIQLGNKVDNLELGVSKLDGRVGILSDKVDIIDNEGKHNVRKYLTDNWPSILVGIAAMIAIGVSFF